MLPYIKPVVLKSSPVSDEQDLDDEESTALDHIAVYLLFNQYITIFMSMGKGYNN